MFSVYHGMWTMDQKADGVLVNMDTTLAALTVTSVAGTVTAGDSVITVAQQVPDGMKLLWKAASGTAPAVAFGTALTAANGWAELPAGGLISTTNGYKITVALAAAGDTTVVAKT